MLKPHRYRSGVRRRIWVAWILLTCTTAVVRWDGTRTATATAFSIASIFPRKTEKVQHDKDLLQGDVQKERQLNEGHTRIPESVSGQPEQVPYPMLSNDVRQEMGNQDANGQGDSVHLQLQTMHQTQQQVHATDDTNGSTPPPSPADQPKVTQVRVHTFQDTATNRTWVALNTSKRKFIAFLECSDVVLPSAQQITTATINLPEQGNSKGEAECAIRNQWRDLWKAQQLITDRTELLAVYQSDNDDNEDANNGSAKIDPQRRRGGFRDLLNLYANRLVAILEDEQHDEGTPPAIRYHSSLVRSRQTNRYGQPLAEETILQQNDHRILVKWLEDNYGMSETLMLQASRFRSLPVPAQLELMHHFLEWFRNHFPYYYDRCDACGASQKDELSAQPPQEVVDHASGGEEDDDDNSTFLGYIYPNAYEIKGKASRTELYQCHKCGEFTRFPRYNSAFDIIQSRRGRCGEYSLLLYRFLRALNHDARWVVDWADHVWAEVLIGENNTRAASIGGAKSGIADPTNGTPRWVHLDPCEAAVDKPLLYEEWGKKQTYIIALYAPLRYKALQVQNRNNGFFLGHLSRLHNQNGAAANGANFVEKASSLVEDVTQEYTSESWENICKRREESGEEVNSATLDAIQDLEQKLFR